MRRHRRWLIALLALVAWAATAEAVDAAGLHRIEVPVADGVDPLVGAVWHPCAAPAGVMTFRGVDIAGTPDCPLEGDELPLVVLSHGARGWFGGHHDTAAALADAGYVVAAITHPDIGRRSWRTNRPAEVKLLIDHMLAAWPDAARLDPDRIGFFGYSRGGYTGLVLLGAEPGFRRMLWHCLWNWSDPMCEAPPDAGGPQDAPWVADGFAHDDRIKAAVLAAPLAIVFSDSELEKLQAPLQLWRPAADELLVYPNHADAVFEALDGRPDYRVIPNAGHFSILAPCSAAQVSAAPGICTDSPAFDRVAFHAMFNRDIVRFFDGHIGAR